MIDGFKQQVCYIVSSIPYGRVMTYGDIAALAGQATAARVVGGIAHFGDPKLPWYRVVNRFGGLASGYPGGMITQQEILKSEGIEVRDFRVVNFEECRWLPSFL